MKYKFCWLYLVIVYLQIFASLSVYAHCQLPCGIYDDHARVKMMLEDYNLITKAIKEIQEFSKNNDALSKSQLIRWVMNKEKHANHIIEIISDYFLTQRIKPTQKDYQERLVKHHKVILTAVTAKQKIDSDTAVALQHAISALLDYYPEEHEEHHHH
jgi:nickel superoxide dismutase